MQLQLTIVYPPAIDFHFMHQRPQQMMKAFAQAGANVIFINPADHFPQETPVYHPYPELPNFTVIHRSVHYRPFVKGKVVFWCAVNQGWFIDCYKHDLAVFDSCDLAADEFSSWRNLIPIIERKTQLIFASSKAIFNEHIARGVRTVLLPNGADYDHFKIAVNQLLRPLDLPDTGGRPLVGYYGAISSWIDMDMVYSIAESFPVVLIGSNRLYNQEIDHPNVTKLDMKSYHDLPTYLSWFDVAIIPFRLTHMIAGCDPVKNYEYLSAGKPVVASEIEELKKFRNLVYFANARNAPDMVARAMTENHELKIKLRQNVALQNTWLTRAKVALTHIMTLL